MNAVKESDRAVSKQIRVLENRLDKALVKFNEALAFNKQVRFGSYLRRIDSCITQLKAQGKFNEALAFNKQVPYGW